jgi:hypothetical protein
MIPVTLEPEPADFDERVRQKGQIWLTNNGILLGSAAPKSTKLPSYWSHSNMQLWDAYSGFCAYLAIFFEWPTGAASTDHFVPKSVHAGMAYEWDNYRLSCLGPNRNKNKYRDVLDPIGLQAVTFVLNLGSGKISPNPLLDAGQKKLARSTIQRLKLDSPNHNAMRAKHFSRYVRGKDIDALQELSPFVWYEANRQGLL